MTKRITTACPHCEQRFAVASQHLGRPVRCPACGEPFRIAAAEAPVRAAPGTAGPAGTASGQAAATEAAARPLCAICQSPLGAGQATTRCPDCGGVVHEDCWQFNQGCGVYGCSQAPPTEGLSSLEIPPSYWGREEKACPNCGRAIRAAAVRCRHCGAVFASATPLGAGAFAVQQDTRARIPAVRTASIWLLIFSFIPCTAPLAAIIGAIWYAQNRRVIRAMPALNSAMCKIAVGVAFVQTGLLLLCGILASMAGG